MLPYDFAGYGSRNYFTVSLELKTRGKAAPAEWTAKEIRFNYDRANRKVLIPDAKTNAHVTRGRTKSTHGVSVGAFSCLIRRFRRRCGSSAPF